MPGSKGRKGLGLTVWFPLLLTGMMDRATGFQSQSANSQSKRGLASFLHPYSVVVISD